jgi:NAD(P)-dependent dehydrogenase (short-subunit alcohol dehydrogenase family)/acyl carrier protein
LMMAGALAARGARSLILIGRSEATPAAAKALQELEASGVTVRSERLDIADLPAFRKLIRELATTAPPLRGVIHAAGVLDDGMLTGLDTASMERVLRPKLLGGLHLAAATADIPLDFFVLFSAGAAWLGAPGQGNYAAANAALEALAHSLRQAHRPATAVAWGRWSGTGMANARSIAGAQGWDALGVGQIPRDRGAAALFALIERRVAVAAVLPIDWRAYLGRVYGDGRPAIFSEVLPATRPDAGAAGESLVSMLQSMPAYQRREALLQRLEALLRKIVGVAKERSIDLQLPVRDLGMDSLMTVEFRNAICRAVSFQFPATLVFDHPTLDALASHLLSVLPALNDRQGEGATEPVAPVSPEMLAMTEDEAEVQLLRELGIETQR